jgi:hypothetical protein
VVCFGAGLEIIKCRGPTSECSSRGSYVNTAFPCKIAFWMEMWYSVNENNRCMSSRVPMPKWAVARDCPGNRADTPVGGCPRLCFWRPDVLLLAPGRCFLVLRTLFGTRATKTNWHTQKWLEESCFVLLFIPAGEGLQGQLCW